MADTDTTTPAPAATGTGTPPPTDTGGWADAAKSAVRSISGSTPQPQTQQMAMPKMEAQALPDTSKPPSVLTPVKATGFKGVLNEVRDWVAGTQGTGIYIDQATGTRYVQHPPLTPAQQWAKIGAEAFRGAAAGLAAGKGAGNQGKALQAGINAEQQAFQQDMQTKEENAQANYARQRQNTLDKADLQIKQLQATQMGLQNKRLETETTELQTKNYRENKDYMESHGGVRIAGPDPNNPDSFYTSDDIHKVMQAHPDFLKDHNQFASIEPVTVPGKGVEFYGLPKDDLTQPVSDADAARGLPMYVRNSDDPLQMGQKTYSPIQPGSMNNATYRAAMNKANADMDADALRIDTTKKAQRGDLPTTSAQARAFAAVTTDPAQKKIYNDLADRIEKDEIALRQASRAQVSVINPGNTALLGAGAPTGRNEAYLQTIPAEYRNQVKAIANGDQPMPPRGKEGMAVRNMVMNYDPTTTEARYKAKQDFKTGADADRLVKLAAVSEHLENALNNSDAAGTVVLGKHSYSDDVIKYERDKNMYVGELGTLVKGGVMTDAEAKNLSEGLDKYTKDARSTALKEDAKLLSGKIEGLFQKYKTAVGTDLDPKEFFNDATQARLQRFGIIAGTPQATPTAAGGGAPAPALQTQQTATPNRPPGATMQVPGNDGKMYWSDGKNNLGVVK